MSLETRTRFYIEGRLAVLRGELKNEEIRPIQMMEVIARIVELENIVKVMDGNIKPAING